MFFTIVKMGVSIKLTAELAGGSCKDGSPLPIHTQDNLVTLTTQAVHCQTSEGRETVINYAARRTFEIDHQARTYQENSLHADVAFRHFEAANRLSIGRVLHAAAANMPGFDRVLIEHHLSVLDREGKTAIGDASATSGGWLKSLLGKGPPCDITSEQRDGFLIYSASGGRLLLSHSIAGHPVEPELLQRFVRFLRSQYNGHPLILERLATSGRIPNEIRYGSLALMQGAFDKRTIRIHSVETAADRSLNLEDYRRLLSAQDLEEKDPVEAALLRAMNTQPVEPVAQKAQRMAEFEASLLAGRNVEAALILCELNLESDTPPAELGAPMRRALDAQVTELMATISNIGQVGEKDAINQTIGSISRHRSAAGNRAHVLKTFESVCHAMLGQIDVARERLLEALAENPRLVGAYKDLGDLCKREYEMAKAWLCWEAARRFGPRHSMLQDVENLEQALRADHPEFF